jgi:hypothetical protein
VTPATDEEYDHALAHHPRLCRPLAAAAGDRRPSAQLRAEFAADAAPGALEAFAGTAAGREWMGRLARALLDRVGRAAGLSEQEVDTAPPSPCWEA